MMKRKIMLTNRSDARDRAEAQFDKTQKPKDVGAKALFEYEKGGRVVREKTARLRSLRMAKEAAGLDAEARDNPDTGSAKLL
jgi:hypothetical protein